MAGILSEYGNNVVAAGMTALQDEIEQWAKEKGWWKPEGRNPLELLMLITTEIAECAEAFRHGNPACDKPGMSDISNAEEELADVIIRILHMAAEFNMNLPEAVLAKMRHNWKRDFRHGGKAH